MSAPIPCRVCGCLPGEPGLCHAITPGGRSCFRPRGYPDWCDACSKWDKKLRIAHPTAPIEALAAEYRADRMEEAAAKRGVIGKYALRVHASRMRRKAFNLLVDAGVIEKAEPLPIKEKDKPLCP